MTMEEGILLFAHSTRRITTNDDGVKIKNEVPSKSWQERFAPRKLKGRLSRKLAVSGERILEEAKQVHPTVIIGDGFLYFLAS